MYCPYCGKEVAEDAEFCMHCGRFLCNRTEGAPDKDFQGRVGAPVVKRHRFDRPLVVVAAIIVAAAVVLSCLPSPPGPLEGRTFAASQETDSLVDADMQRCIIPVSGFVSDGTRIADLLVIPNDNAERSESTAVRIVLDHSVSDRYSNFRWTIVSLDSGVTVGVLDKTEGVVTLYTSSHGGFRFTVDCYNTVPGTGETHVFVVDIGWYVDYHWRYLGGDFSLFRTFGSDTANAYLSDTVRTIAKYSDCTRFVRTDSAVEDIMSDLRGLYMEAFGDPGSDQGLADFVLCAVQLNIGYASDYEVHQAREYFCYPAETLFQGVGDCEDTSILYAALMKAAGYRTAIVMLPEHAMAAVALRTFTVPDGYPGHTFLERDADDLVYYACETTAGEFVPVGVSASTYHGEPYQSYMGRGLAGYGSYGFYGVEP